MGLFDAVGGGLASISQMPPMSLADKMALGVLGLFTFVALCVTVYSFYKSMK